MSVVVKGMDKPTDCCYCPFYSYGYCKALGACVNTEHGIDTRCPLVEIEQYEVKRGKWIDFKNGWKCSACGKWNNETSNFCPNCGADMREREGE